MKNEYFENATPEELKALMVDKMAELATDVMIVFKYLIETTSAIQKAESKEELKNIIKESYEREKVLYTQLQHLEIKG